jgi:chemotaxis signal transduction protein
VRKLVRFRSTEGAYAVPVEKVVQVRSAGELRSLPEPRSGVAGLLRQGDEAVTVLSLGGAVGEQVLVIDDGGLTFGLLVAEVLGVQSVRDDEIRPPPPGQDRATVAGVLAGDDGLVLVLDCAALRGRLS